MEPAHADGLVMLGLGLDGVPAAELEPTIPQYINASNAVYSRDYSRLPPDLRPFEAGGEHLALEITADGFYGAAFLTADNQIIVAFEGTHLSALEEEPAFVTAQLAADVEIYLGSAPAAYGDATDFTETVLAAAAAQGIDRGDVFVSGHSLGGAEAQYVAATLDLEGVTFGGPGLPASLVPSTGQERVTNIIGYGDPVGNYSASPNYLGDVLFSDRILHFGEQDYVGDILGRLALQAAAALYGSSAADGLAALAALAVEYHPLTQYAAALGVVLSDPNAYLEPDGDLSDAAAFLAALRTTPAAATAVFA
jgi:hypothetical protein